MPIMFIESKIIHLKTPYFKKESIKYSHEYLRTLNLKQLKWVKKLGYIDKAYFMILKKEKLSK
jgi:hypothetical protein